MNIYQAINHKAAPLKNSKAKEIDKQLKSINKNIGKAVEAQRNSISEMHVIVRQHAVLMHRYKHIDAEQYLIEKAAFEKAAEEEAELVNSLNDLLSSSIPDGMLEELTSAYEADTIERLTCAADMLDAVRELMTEQFDETENFCQVLHKLMTLAPRELVEFMKTVNTPHRDFGGNFLYTSGTPMNTSFPLDIALDCDKYKIIIDASLNSLER